MFYTISLFLRSIFALLTQRTFLFKFVVLLFPLVKISTSCIYGLLMNSIYEFLLQFRDSIKVHVLLHLLHCCMFHYKTFITTLHWLLILYHVSVYKYIDLSKKNVVITIFLLISFTFCFVNKYSTFINIINYPVYIIFCFFFLKNDCATTFCQLVRFCFVKFITLYKC